MKNKALTILLVAAFLAAVFLWVDIFPIWAQGDPGVLFKLNKILENQVEIIKRLDGIKSDLERIKPKL